MDDPNSHTLSDYVVGILSGLTRLSDAEGSSMLSAERVVALRERLRELDSARRHAESEGRDYPLG
jgi:hypothetical protein